VANVAWGRQSKAFRGEDGKVVGNQNICIGSGEKYQYFG
jgi:hypothetical protein